MRLRFWKRGRATIGHMHDYGISDFRAKAIDGAAKAFTQGIIDNSIGRPGFTCEVTLVHEDGVVLGRWQTQSITTVK